MTCKICHNNETDNTSGICDECIHITQTTRRYSIPLPIFEQLFPSNEMRIYLEYWGKKI